MTDQLLVLGTPRDADFPNLSKEAVARIVAELTVANDEDVTHHGRRRRRVFAVTAAASLAAAAVIGLTITGSGPASAPVWAADPTAAPPKTASSLAESCAATVAQIPDTYPKATNQDIVIAELRGSSGLVVLASADTGWSECLILDDGQISSATSPITPPGATGSNVSVLSNASLGGSTDLQGNTRGWMGITGRVGPPVAAIEVTRTDGSTLHATVANGWFAAWWFGNDPAVSLRIVDDSGTVTTQSL